MDERDKRLLAASRTCPDRGLNPHNLGMCPDQKSNPQPFGYGTMFQPTKPRQAGHFAIYIK